jgi:hypothetical protein
MRRSSALGMPVSASTLSGTKKDWANAIKGDREASADGYG